MNLFNCFQAVAFYTVAPFLIQYLFNNGFNTWAYIGCFAEFIGFVMMSIAIHESKLLKD